MSLEMDGCRVNSVWVNTQSCFRIFLLLKALHKWNCIKIELNWIFCHATPQARHIWNFKQRSNTFSQWEWNCSSEWFSKAQLHYLNTLDMCQNSLESASLIFSLSIFQKLSTMPLVFSIQKCVFSKYLCVKHTQKKVWLQLLSVSKKK